MTDPVYKINPITDMTYEVHNITLPETLTQQLWCSLQELHHKNPAQDKVERVQKRNKKNIREKVGKWSMKWQKEHSPTNTHAKFGSLW